MDFSSLSAPRITEERKRLGLNQETAGEKCGVSREMWGKYERGKAAMGGDVLMHFANVGADVQYVLTGVRQGQGIGESAVYQAVLDAVDLLSLDKKVDAGQLAKAVLKLCAKSSATTAAVSAPTHQRIEGSLQVFHQAQTGTIIGGDLVQKGRTIVGSVIKKGK